MPNKILDTDLCITKSVVKLMWARKKQTPTHAAKMRRVKLNTRQRFMWPTKNHMCCGSKNGATKKYKAPVLPCCYRLNVAVALTLPPCCRSLNDISLSLPPCWFRLEASPQQVIARGRALVTIRFAPPIPAGRWGDVKLMECTHAPCPGACVHVSTLAVREV